LRLSPADEPGKSYGRRFADATLMNLRPLEGSPQLLLCDGNPGEQSQFDVRRPRPCAFDLVAKRGDDPKVDGFPQLHGGFPSPAGTHLADSK